MRDLSRVALGLILIVGMAVAAGIDGTWNFTFDTEAGVREAPITLKLSGEEVTGTVGGEVPVKGTYKAGELSLKFPYYSEEAGFTADLIIHGKLKDGRISGEWQFDQYSGTFTATRGS